MKAGGLRDLLASVGFEEGVEKAMMAREVKCRLPSCSSQIHRYCQADPSRGFETMLDSDVVLSETRVTVMVDDWCIGGCVGYFRVLARYDKRLACSIVASQ